MANATRHIYNLRTRDKAGKVKSSNGESGVTHATWWDGEWQKIVEAKKNRGPTKKELKKAEIRRGFQEQANGAAAAARIFQQQRGWGVEFKLLEVLGHNARFTNCVWSHVYFTAAPKSSACIDGGLNIFLRRWRVFQPTHIVLQFVLSWIQLKLFVGVAFAVARFFTLPRV
ncbi:hypothetical protein OROHE_010965 [Orobanche hederae]